MFKGHFKRIAASVMALLMVLSLGSWDGLAMIVKADDVSADVSLGNSVYSSVDEMGQEIIMGDILVRTSKEADYLSLVYDNETHSADVSDCETFKLAWAVFEGYEVVTDSLTVTTTFIDSESEPIVETFDITDINEIEISADYDRPVTITVDDLCFGAIENGEIATDVSEEVSEDATLENEGNDAEDSLDAEDTKDEEADITEVAEISEETEISEQATEEVLDFYDDEELEGIEYAEIPQYDAKAQESYKGLVIGTNVYCDVDCPYDQMGYFAKIEYELYSNIPSKKQSLYWDYYDLDKLVKYNYITLSLNSENSQVKSSDQLTYLESTTGLSCSKGLKITSYLNGVFKIEAEKEGTYTISYTDPQTKEVSSVEVEVINPYTSTSNMSDDSGIYFVYESAFDDDNKTVKVDDSTIYKTTNLTADEAINGVKDGVVGIVVKEPTEDYEKIYVNVVYAYDYLYSFSLKNNNGKYILNSEDEDGVVLDYTADIYGEENADCFVLKLNVPLASLAVNCSGFFDNSDHGVPFSYKKLPINPYTINSKNVKLTVPATFSDEDDLFNNISVKLNGHELIYETDYSIDLSEYYSNKRPGKVNFHICFGGYFTGEIACSSKYIYDITKTDINVSAVYNPTTQKPDYSCIINEEFYGIKLDSNDYSVDYGYIKTGETYKKSTSIKPGETYFAKITGKGNYGGIEYISYEYEKASIKDAYFVSDYIEALDSTEINPIVMYKGCTLKKDVDYSINIEAVSQNQFCVIFAGINNFQGEFEYTLYSLIDISKVTVKCNKSTLEWADDLPSFTLTYKGKELVQDTDYTVDFLTCKVVGKNVVIIEGRGFFYGKIEKTITYKALGDISKAKVTILNDKQEYDGEGKNPEFKVELNNDELSIDHFDYYWENEDGSRFGIPDSAGSHNIKIIGDPESGYTGTKTIKYTILPKDIKECCSLHVGNAVYVDSKTVPTPEFYIRFDEDTLTEGVDYTVSYGKNKNAGNTNTITIKGKGNFSGSINDNYLIDAKSLEDVDSNLDNTYFVKNNNETIKINLTLSGLAINKDYQISCKDTDNTPIAVDSKGNVTAGQGTYTVKYTACDGGNYCGDKVFDFEVKSLNIKELKDCSLSLNETSEIVFDGYEKEPSVMVQDASGNILEKIYPSPVPGSVFDYDVIYSNNINVGKATVTACGTGNYEGAISKQFEIKKATKDKVRFIINDAPYIDDNGKVVIPEFELKLSNGYVLKEKEDYTYKINKYQVAPSEPISVEVTFKGKNFESAKETYPLGELVPLVVDVNDLTIDVKDYVYTGKEITPACTIKYNGTTLKVGTDVKVKYSNSSANVMDKVVDAGQYDILISGIGKYSFSSKYPIEVDGELYALVNSNVSAVNVLPADASKISLKYKTTTFKYSQIEGEDYSETLTNLGVAIKQSFVSAKFGNKEIDSAIGFETIPKAIPGKQVCQLSVNNSNFTGTIPVTFTITADKKIDLSKDENIAVTTSGNRAEYSPDGAKLGITVTYKGAVLTEGVDYKVEYKDNKKLYNESKTFATATIKGIGQYTGTYNEKFEFIVVPCNISDKIGVDNVITSSAAKVFQGSMQDWGLDYSMKIFVYATTYTGNEIKFDPKLKINGKAMTLNKDYMIESYGKYDYSGCVYDYSNATDAGGYRVHIRGIGNYVGLNCESIVLVVMPADISKASVDVNKLEYGDDESAVIKSVKYKGGILEEVLDYEYHYTPVYWGSDEIKYDSELYKWIKDTYKLSAEIPDDNYWGYDPSTGTHKGYIYGTNNFCGIKAFDYTIKGLDIKKIKFEKIEDRTVLDTEVPNQVVGFYNGQMVIGNVSTVSGVDYNTAGTKTVLVKTDGFVGEQKLTYKVNPVIIDNNYVSVRMQGYDSVAQCDFNSFYNEFEYEYEYEYIGKTVKPCIVVKYDGILLDEGDDYTVSYSNNTNVAAGDSSKAPTVTIKFKGNYSGTYKKTFSIVPCEVEYDNIQVNNVTKGAYKSVPVVTVNGKKLSNGKDFTCTYYYVNKTAIKRNGIGVYVNSGVIAKDKDVVPAGTKMLVKIKFIGNYCFAIDRNAVDEYYYSI